MQTQLQNLFPRDYSFGWEFLYETLKPFELVVLMELAHRAGLHERALFELDGYTIQEEVSEHLGLSPRKSKLIFSKLFNLGAYGKFRVAKADNPTFYIWVVNPYLCNHFQSDLVELFKGTEIAIEHEKRYLAKISSFHKTK